jgi:hypothetical protein
MSNAAEAGPFTRTLDAHCALQPGQEGYWRVHGATTSDAHADDFVMVKRRDGEVTEHEVTRVIPEADMLGAMYVRFCRRRLLETMRLPT